jgi:hypothetical protein
MIDLNYKVFTRGDSDTFHCTGFRRGTQEWDDAADGFWPYWVRWSIGRGDLVDQFCHWARSIARSLSGARVGGGSD